MDTDLLWFYVRMWDLRATDLMQGPVYGLFTDETGSDEGLFPFFNYDELFGTVLNRFVVQAVAGYPLTVCGKRGGLLKNQKVNHLGSSAVKQDNKPQISEDGKEDNFNEKHYKI